MYPKTISLVVANVDEEKKVRALGLKVDGEPTYQEYPKMLYHDNKEQIVVATADEETHAAGKGFHTQAPGSIHGSPRPASTVPLQGANSEAAARANYQQKGQPEWFTKLKK
jgi:hypothetical protein